MLTRYVFLLSLLFACPSARADVTSGRWSIGLSMSGGLPVIAAKIEGREEPIRLVVDTAAGGTILDYTLANLLNLGVDGSIQVEGAGGTSSAQRAAKPTFLTIGSNLKLQVQPILTDMSRFSKEGISYDGILGNDVLSRFDMRFDVPAGQLIMASPGASPALLEDLRCADNLRSTRSGPALAGFTMLDMTVKLEGPKAGSAIARAVLDTGAMVTIINPKAAGALGVVEGDDRLKPVKRVRGMGQADVRTEILEPTEVAFSGITIADASVRVSELPVFEILGLADAPAAILGIDLLRHIPIGTTAGAEKVCFGERP